MALLERKRREGGEEDFWASLVELTARISEPTRGSAGIRATSSCLRDWGLGCSKIQVFTGSKLWEYLNGTAGEIREKNAFLRPGFPGDLDQFLMKGTSSSDSNLKETPRSTKKRRISDVNGGKATLSIQGDL